MSEALFTTEEVAHITGVPRPTIQWLPSAGIVVPAVPGSRGGVSHRWSLIQVLAITVSRAAAKRGVDSDLVCALYRYLAGMTTETLEGAFVQGRTHVFICGTKLLPKLVPLNACLHNPVITEAGPAIAGALAPAALDVRQAWDLVKHGAKRVLALRNPQRRLGKSKRKTAGKMASPESEEDVT